MFETGDDIVSVLGRINDEGTQEPEATECLLRDVGSRIGRVMASTVQTYNSS